MGQFENECTGFSYSIERRILTDKAEIASIDATPRTIEQRVR